ncbi:hypothetical protein IMG5_185690 [Ichthyophthirius multifiliis]|uniref:Enkurin domain-containing protein n=1 Tax=Ichthyophthirius multifiliis TaxID=5932 RepID=G0R3J7_ICHMU|nr:hypothetical protein IMG5_185690 [Ichthyophthirius multifiliis]EGR27986.1 hypothetical protein IMG5_185690 [Ichthyophthirius multifiliis]|eukprot:XP_004027331.1 hypothetical protein IMG5_185690 [Ichthyophthirius multifiliis]
MEGESIYNLIPKEYVPPPKEKRYRSQYPPHLAPTGSTLINHTTSRPGVANLIGDYSLVKGPHSHKDFSKTLGKLPGSIQPYTSEYRKKNTGTMGSNKLPDIQKFKYPDEDKRRPNVPLRVEKPLMGQVSHKNYIVSNAVENILSAPKMLKQEQDYLTKKDFGKIPDYLIKNKENLENEYKMIQNLHLSEAEEVEKQKYMMSVAEVKQLRDGLKAKWESVNNKYQTITHINKIDTIGLKRKKEESEKELTQLEKDIAKLNKQYVFVDTNI